MKIIRNLPNDKILFIPDSNLGSWVAQQVPDKELKLVQGGCPTHLRARVADVEKMRAQHPQALLLAHPECHPSVTALADFVGSTTEIMDCAAKGDSEEYIIGTEVGVLYDLQKKNPDKTFYFPKTTPICPDMKTITLDKIIHVLKTGENSISIPTEMKSPAGLPLERMLELSK